MQSVKKPRKRIARDLPISSAVEEDDSEVAATIMSAAVVAMSRNGYHATSVREIASLAGVAVPAIYHYFGSKHSLLVEIMTRGNEHLYRHASDELQKAGSDPVVRLDALVEVFVSRHLRSQRESFLGSTELRSLSPEARRKIIGYRDRTQGLFDEVVSGGVKAGIFNTPYPKDAARAIVTMCTAVSNWYREGGDLAPDEVVRRYQHLCLATVGGSRGAPTKRAKAARNGAGGRTRSREAGNPYDASIGDAKT